MVMNKGSFALSVSLNAAMSIVISRWLNYLDFLINQVNHSKNGFQPQLIRYESSVDADDLINLWRLV